MVKTSDQIVFFGSGPVAAKSLEFLVNIFTVEAVVTKPNLGDHINSLPVIELAKKLGIKLYTPSNKQDLDDLIRLKVLKSDIGVLIDYGIIVSQEVIDYFKLGIVNSHFSLLPLLRGPDPISFAILNGSNITGVSLMLLSSGIDEGNLIAQNNLKVGNLNNIELTKKLIDLSNNMIAEFLPKYISGELMSYPQSTSLAPTYSKKLDKQDGLIDWHKSAIDIEREIRAYISWPKSSTNIYGIPVIITSAEIVESFGKPGDIKYDKNSLTIGCLSGSLSINKLKPSGKNEMSISSFISGYSRLFKLEN